LLPKFTELYLRALNLNKLANHNAQPLITGTMIKDQMGLIPSKGEQRKIITFLEHETSKLDLLINKQERLVDLLKEKRQAVVSQAVTRGLNPNVAMKYSGEEWLGEIPNHWELKKFKYLFKIRKRIAGEVGHEILSITQNGIKIKDITSGEGQLSMDYSKYQLVYKGDLAMNHMDLLTGFVDISKYDGVTSPDYRVFTLEDKQSSTEYFLNILQMGYFDRLFYPLGQGAAHIGRWRLPSEAFNEFIAPCPPLQEQEEITAFISMTFSKVDKLLEKAISAVSLMQERKKALISAAVTGKIDVRDYEVVTNG
jgi:type I restriction enzyme S subunit